jgi:C4-dicarboxylate-specific signal transduction histidine kinase
MIKNKQSIIKKIIVLMIAVIGICGVICSVVVFSYTDSKIVEMKKQELIKLHNERSEHLSHELGTSIELVKLIAIRTRIVEYLANPTEIRREELVKIFDQYPNDNPGYLSIYLLDRDGKALISTDRSFIGNNYSFRNYFIKAIEGTPYAEALYGVTSNQFGYYFSAPVMGNSGKPIGVVVAKRAPESVYEGVVTENLFSNSNTILADEYGVILYANRPDRILKSLGKLSTEQTNIFSKEKRYGTENYTSIDYQELQDFINSGKDSNIIEFWDAEDQKKEILSVHKVGSYPFYFIYEIYVSDLQQLAIQITLVILSFIIICVILAIIILTLYFKKMMTPFKILQNLTEKA